MQKLEKCPANLSQSLISPRNCLLIFWVHLIVALMVYGRNTAAATAYSPHVTDVYPRQLLWGDTHLHTGLSMDARLFGSRLTPADAYRFGRGEAVDSTYAGPAKLNRPLDFLVIADHSDSMGAMNGIIAGNPALLRDPTVKRWHEQLAQGGKAAGVATADIIRSLITREVPAVLTEGTFLRSVWQDYLQTAEQFNKPGEFTALIGYEWTSTDGGNNLHRNVIYRGDAESAAMMTPYTTGDSSNPEDLWQWMARFEEVSGSQVLAIPHNANVSNGRMFPVGRNPATRELLDAEYVRERARWEPLYEITQIKGDSESHPLLSPDDEFAGFDQLWDKANLGLVPKAPDMLQYEYAREALKNGLELELELGVNPYKFGVIGSSDSHTGLATAEENNFFGKDARFEPSPERWQKVFAENADVRILGWELVGSGYAAVWARENTREAIFDAMMRREVYATTGPRISVRFFGGWHFGPDDVDDSNFVGSGYAGGVPMGGDLPAGQDGDRPTFMAVAMKDSESGNLDRLQIVKGWNDSAGAAQERVYDIAWSDSGKRPRGSNGKVPDVGNTVNLASASWSNSIGAATLRAVWQDPEFDPGHAAFYYLRVLEIPTPRWTAYDAQRFGIVVDSEVPMTVRERAYTSPIWYTP